MRLRGVGVALLLFAVACGAERPVPVASSLSPPMQGESDMVDWSSLRMQLTRGACYGTCPDYVVEVRGDGRVTYCGGAFVKEVGERKRTIPHGDVEALYAAFLRIDFWNLSDRYEGAIDPAIDGLTLVEGSRTKRVELNTTNEEGMRLLSGLEALIDKTAGVDEWVSAHNQKARTDGKAYDACLDKSGIERFPPAQVILPEYPVP